MRSAGLMSDTGTITLSRQALHLMSGLALNEKSLASGASEERVNSNIVAIHPQKIRGVVFTVKVIELQCSVT